MKKLMVIICVLLLLLCCGCTKTPENSSSGAQSTVVSSSSIADEPMVDEVELPEDMTDSEEESAEPVEVEEPIVSTITAPVSATLYRDGKAIPMTDAALNLKIAQEIESWFAGLKEILAMQSGITPEIIEDIKADQTCIEFIYDDLISINGKTTTFRESTRFILTLENDKFDMIILGDADGYRSGPLGTQGNSVDKILSLIEHLQAEPIVSTITAPVSATLYRGGKAIPMTDAALNLKIAQEIESWFAELKGILAMQSGITPEIIEDIKADQTCIEFIYDDLISINGKTTTFRESTRFILTLENDKFDMIILGDADGYRSGPLGTQGNSVDKILSLIEHLQ